MARKTPGGDLGPQQSKTGVSLLFAAGDRPTAGDIALLLAAPRPGDQPARVSHRPDDDAGWLELLASGLTFDLTGLSPAPAAPAPLVGHVYGLPADIGKFAFEAVVLTPGEHISAGVVMIPVARMLTGLAASLASRLPVKAICWNPAGCWIEPRYFARIIAGWLSGGPFPVLGLIGVVRRPDGVFTSSGLDVFVGQEIWLPAADDEPASDTVKLMSRLVDEMIRSGRLDRSGSLVDLGGEPLTIGPSSDGRYVMVSRSR
jgi:hypothetical protein